MNGGGKDLEHQPQLLPSGRDAELTEERIDMAPRLYLPLQAFPNLRGFLSLFLSFSLSHFLTFSMTEQQMSYSITGSKAALPLP